MGSPIEYRLSISSDGHHLMSKKKKKKKKESLPNVARSLLHVILLKPNHLLDFHGLCRSLSQSFYLCHYLAGAFQGL